jgi:hypothetical protein
MLLWRSMRKLEDFTIKQLASHARQDYGTAHKYVQTLKQWDYVACTEARLPRETDKSARYRLVLNTGPHAPVPTETGVDDPNLNSNLLDGITRCWLAMRQLRQFDSRQIQALTGLSQRTVETYLGKFRRCGLLGVVQPNRSGSPTGSYRVYRLAINPGPLAPVFRADGSVFEPNTCVDLDLSQGGADGVA